MSANTLTSMLSHGLNQLKVEVSHTNQLLDFLLLLEKWNKTYNITAIRDLEQMVILHILDSASVYRYLSGNSIIDVGTGGGLPGIIFAILNPELNITLLDSSQKKTRFLRFVQRQLKVDNITIVCQRVEKYQAKTDYDVVISRAFSEVGNFLRLSGHLCGKKGQMLAMKGPRVESESHSFELGFKLTQELDIIVPYLDAQRRLLIFNRI